MATEDSRRNGTPAAALSPHHTLNEIVALVPGAEGPLLHLGYDTCCGGSRTLGEASAVLGLDPDAVLRRLEGGEPGRSPLAGVARKGTPGG